MGNRQGSDAKSFATVRVVLAPGASFFPGEEVVGHVSAVVVQEIPLSEVFVTLMGVAELGIDLASERSSIYTKSVLCHTFQNGVARPGTYEFPFRLQLPVSAPPSVSFLRRKPGKHTCDKATIAYSLSAGVKGSGWFKKKESLHTVSLEVFSSPNTPKPTLNLTTTLDAGFAFFRTFGKVTVRATCDRGSYLPGDDCHVTLFLKNESNADIDMGSVKLDESVWLKVKFFKRQHNDNRWVLTPRDAESARETFQGEAEENDASDLKRDSAPPPPPRPPALQGLPFGTAGHETSLRFTVTLPLNAQHQSMHLAHLRVSYALDMKLAPRAFFANPVRLLLPIGMCRAASFSATAVSHELQPSAPPLAPTVELDSEGADVPFATAVGVVAPDFANIAAAAAPVASMDHDVMCKT